MTYQLRNKKLYPQPEVGMPDFFGTTEGLEYYAARKAYETYLTTVLEASDELLKLYKDGDMIEEGEIEVRDCLFDVTPVGDGMTKPVAFPKQPIQRSESQEELWKEFYWGAPSAENNPNYAWAVSHYEIKRKHPNTSP